MRFKTTSFRTCQLGLIKLERASRNDGRQGPNWAQQAISQQSKHIDIY